MFNNGLRKIVADLAEQVQHLAANVDDHFGKHAHSNNSGHSHSHSLDQDLGQSSSGQGHDHFSIATTTIPVYHLIVDCLNMLGAAPSPRMPYVLPLPLPGTRLGHLV